MMTVAAEQMFEVIVRARQVGHAVAMEQTGRIAGGDLQEVIDGRLQGAGPVTPLAPRRDQAVVARLHRGGGVAGGVTAPQSGTQRGTRLGRGLKNQ